MILPCTGHDTWHFYISLLKKPILGHFTDWLIDSCLLNKDIMFSLIVPREKQHCNIFSFWQIYKEINNWLCQFSSEYNLVSRCVYLFDFWICKMFLLWSGRWPKYQPSISRKSTLGCWNCHHFFVLCCQWLLDIRDKHCCFEAELYSTMIIANLWLKFKSSTLSNAWFFDEILFLFCMYIFQI